MERDFQSASTRQGKVFEVAVESWLTISGWTVIDRHNRNAGAEIDLIATDPLGVLWWVECKGSWEGKEQNRGCRRDDTVKKAVAVAWLLKLENPNRPRYMLITSHMPNPGTLPDRMLRTAKAEGLFDEVMTFDAIQIRATP